MAKAKYNLFFSMYALNLHDIGIKRQVNILPYYTKNKSFTDLVPNPIFSLNSNSFYRTKSNTIIKYSSFINLLTFVALKREKGYLNLCCPQLM
jgi:hypothetical protein